MAERQEITVRAELREGRGKNDARRLRARGMVPLTVYGGEGEPVAAAAPLAELAAILRSGAGHNAIFTLDVDGVGASEVMFHDRQIDPVHSRLVHADLRRLVRGQELELTVPLHLDGEPEGVRMEGGVLETVLREIQIRCRPSQIPDAIHADVSGMKAHDVLHVSDLVPDEGVVITTDPDAVVATVAVVREEPVESGTPEEAVSEPEVISKGKKDEEQ
jgi:large subunit ribosomal protein L25